MPIKRLFVSLALLVFNLPVLAAQYDIVINNGRVMDPETRLDAVRNVGIKDGKIATITKIKISGKETVDATGHVVAPGFIDTHTHSSNKFNIKMSMMDGVTSGMDFEAGALNVAKWYAREEGKWPMNYGQCASHETVRMVIHDGLDISGPADASDMFDGRARALEADNIAGWSVTVSNLDRIIHHATIVEIDGESYRKKHQKGM